MKRNAIRCPKCGDIVYSRCLHDFCSCSCGEVSIDGGEDYNRIVFKKKFPKLFKIEIDATEEELFNDWNWHLNKFGIIKEKK